MEKLSVPRGRRKTDIQSQVDRDRGSIRRIPISRQNVSETSRQNHLRHRNGSFEKICWKIEKDFLSVFQCLHVDDGPVSFLCAVNMHNFLADSFVIPVMILVQGHQMVQEGISKVCALYKQGWLNR